MTGATKTIALQIDPDTRDRIERLAKQRQSTPQKEVNAALALYLEQEEKRETYKQDARNAWDKYQNTGLHANVDEVTAWLETWGDADEQAAPPCHK